MGIAAALDGASKVPYSLWTSVPMILAYIMFGLAIVCLACAVRRVPFPLAAGDAVQEHEPLPPQHRPSPSAITAAAKTSRMNAPRGSAVSLGKLRELIVEGEAMRGRVADQRGPLALVPPGLPRSVAEWKAKVGTVLASRPELLDQFQAALAPTLITFQGPAGKLHDELDQRINVLKAIVRGLES